jgi:hypothetical protein
MLVVASPAFAQRIDIHLDPQPAISGGCPAHVHFTGYIRTFEPMDVTYQWLRSDGGKSEHTIHFPRGLKRDISTDWTLSADFQGWVQLVILDPKQLQTIKAEFEVHCAPRR